MNTLVARLMKLGIFLGLLCAFGPLANIASAQNYQDAFGVPPFMTALPSEGGSIDAATGNMHIEIPFFSYPQRGAPPLRLALVYDSTVWSAIGGVWQVNNDASLAGAWRGAGGVGPGWRLVMTPGLTGSVGGTPVTNNVSLQLCPNGKWDVTTNNFIWTAGDGTTHAFPITVIEALNTPLANCHTDTPIADAFASDSSGYHMFVSDYGNTLIVYARDGSVAFSTAANLVLAEDTNGNSLSYLSPDTVARSFFSSGGSCSASICIAPLNSTGGVSVFQIQLTSPLSVHTAFGQSGVTECSTSCSNNFISSVTLPDGSTYSFTYDNGTSSGNYGMMTSMTLPTGATVNYTYSNFTDAYGNVGRWISSRAIGSNTWSYSPSVLSTCTSTSVGCEQSLTVTQPNGDHAVYTFELDNGAWPIQMVSYDSSSTVLSTQTTSWDFSQSCVVPAGTCIGHQYETKLSDTTTLPVPGSGNLNRTTQYTYDTSTNDGNITTVKEWNFYPSSLPGTPDRITDISYLTGSSYAAINIMNRPASVIVTDGSGSTQFSKTLYSYDGSGGLVCAKVAGSCVSSIQNHDDTNYGTSFTTRGNLTQVQKWIGGSSYLTSSMVYDTTGQVVSATDPAGNTTSLAYDDSFLDDASTATAHSALSLPTNAYLTQVTQPTVGSNSFVSNFSYYYGTGQIAKTTDVNGQVSVAHYLDPFSRPTSSIPPIGWSLTSYTSATQVDSYTAVSDTTPSTSCTGCVHSQVDLDSLGRPQYSKVINNPTGTTTSQTSYDSNGRPYNVTAPNYPSGPITAADTTAFDGLSRPVSISHADGSASYAYYGAAVTGAGGNGTQQCGPPSGCPYGYPVLSKDEAGKVHETWTDGFGRLIEVDEPVAIIAAAGGGTGTSSGSEQFSSGSSSTAGSGTVTIGGSEQGTEVEVDPVCELFDCGGNCVEWSDGSRDGSPFFTWVNDSGIIHLTVNGHTNFALYNSSSTTSSIASALGTAVNADSGASVTASVSGSVITLTAKTTGSSTNYSLSASFSTSDPTDFPSGSFTTSNGSALTGGATGSGSTWDAGTVSITVNGHSDSMTYGSSDTSSSVASALASAITADSSAYVNASASGTTITLTAKTTGAATNYSFSTSSSTSYPGIFSSPSFSISVSGSALTGGVDANPANLSSPLYTTYAYDTAGNLLTVTQGAQTRTYTYDGLGRTLTAHIPETNISGTQQATTSNYDADSTCGTSFPGQLVSTVDARGVRTCLQYDALGRVTQKSYNVGSTGVPSTATVTYSYDSGGSSANALGRLTSMTDGVGSETYTYDVAGRVTHLAKVIDSVTYGMDYTYNVAGEPLTVAYPSSTTPKLTSGYDAIGRLCGVGASGSTCSSGTIYANSFSYTAPGQATGFTLGNGVAASFGYSNNRLQMTSLAYTKSSTTLLGLNYYYGYDATNCPTGASGNNGQIQCVGDATSTAGAGRSAKYSYDELGRLSTTSTAGSSTYPAWGLSWTYDRYGNRTAQTVTAGSAMSDSLSISTSTNQVTGTGYSYDANGNMLGDGVNTMTYDAENRMVTSSNGTSSGAYVYDGNGLRVKKCVPNCSSATTTTRYIFSGSKVIAEYDNGAAATSPSREYLYAGGLKVATLVSSTPTYHLRDHLSVRVNTDSSGSIVGEQGHYPFGDSWYLNSTTTKEQFTTYERDAESGNDYAMARYHINRLGRFSSIDPLSGHIGNPQSLNHYAYATNDPINRIDPMGMADSNPYAVSTDDCGDAAFTTGNVCTGEGDPTTGESGSANWKPSWWAVLGQGGPNGAPMFKVVYGDVVGCESALDCSPFNTSDLSKMLPRFRAFVQSQNPSGGAPCIHPTLFQRAGMSAQAALAEYKNETIGVGVGGTTTVGIFYTGMTVSFSRELVVSPSGQAAFVNTWTVPYPGNTIQNSRSVGVGGYGGAQLSFSNATSPQDLADAFINIGAGGGGEGLGGGMDVAFGVGASNQNIVQSTGTLGGGFGGGIGATLTYSTVTPICGH